MSFKHNHSRTQVAVLCQTIFIAFVFCYIFFYQSDLLTLAQHVWSDGQTTYLPVVGAAIITSVLVLIERLVSFFFELPRLIKSLTFLPSLMLLGTLCSVHVSATGTITFGAWPVITGISLIAYLVVVKMLSNLAPLQRPVMRTSIVSKLSWCNLLILIFGMFFCISIGNNDTQLHHRLHTEILVNAHDYANAVKEPTATLHQEPSEHDASLTMLRALALAKTGELGDRFFHYPHSGGSRSLLPQADGSVSFLLGNDKSVWNLLGLIPAKSGRDYVTSQGIDTRMFLHRLAGDTTLTKRPAVRDYLLCSYLLDRDLPGFASQIKRFYCDGSSADSLSVIFDSLPRHYKEALILYTHTCSNRVLSYTDAVIDADYKDFYALMRKETTDATQGRKPGLFHQRDPRARYNTLQEVFSGTYWLYYYNK